jgi:hypothetical protein
MYYNSDVISYLQSNKILALKLDHALTGVGKAVSKQIETIGAGAKRALFYTSCFTDEYQDVCKQLKTEDIRFRDAAYRLLTHEDIVDDMLKIYFDELLRYKTSEQLERIKQLLMAVNVHIAADSLTKAGFAFAVASAVRMGLNLSMEMSALTGRWVPKGVAILGGYGIVQKAADSAYRLHIQHPSYYSALYAQDLGMMYFLIEPVLERAGALNAQWASDTDLINIICKLIR